MKILKLLPVLCALPLVAQKNSTAERLDAASVVLQEIMDTKDKSIPQDLLDKARCVVVVPGVKKGAFIVGARYGRGFVSCRKAGAGWSAPGALKVEGGSVGFQIGGSETDVIMIVMNDNGAKKLIESSKFTIGGEAEAAAGPVGRTGSAETDAWMRAEILTYSRSRGAFAGISLKGGTLRNDDEAIQELYGSKLTNSQIVFGSTKSPAAASKLIGLLNKYSARKS